MEGTLPVLPQTRRVGALREMRCAERHSLLGGCHGPFRKPLPILTAWPRDSGQWGQEEAALGLEWGGAGAAGGRYLHDGAFAAGFLVSLIMDQQLLGDLRGHPAAHVAAFLHAKVLS